jgi:ribosomal protein L12E/L44/L45/RPP1/RPP2
MSGTSFEARRRAHRAGPAVAVVLALAVVLGACAEPAPDRAELVDLLERAGISADESRCAAKAVVDTLTDAQIQDIMQRGGSALVDDPKRTDDASDKVRTALAACRDAAAPTSSTVSTSTLVTETSLAAQTTTVVPTTQAPQATATTVP